LGPSNLDRIEVRGVPIAKVARTFKTGLDQVKEEARGAVEVVDRTRCSGCTTVVGTVLMLLSRRAGAIEEIKGTRIYVGPIPPEEIKKEGRFILVGDCIKGFEDYPGFVPGCPPTVCETMAAISLKDVRLTFFERADEVDEQMCSYVCG
jgi:hypothetical protein